MNGSSDDDYRDLTLLELISIQADESANLEQQDYIALQQNNSLKKFCSDGSPVNLFFVSNDSKKLLLQVAPTSLAIHAKSKSIYAERALNVLDILSSVKPLPFSCEDFEPLKWVGSSCYVDSDLMTLLAVPNQFITDNVLSVNLVSEPKGRHKYVCTKKLKIGQKADPILDLKNRQKVQSALVDIANSLRGTGEVPNCTSLRKILTACPHPEQFNLPGNRDAGEYLSYILSMFPDTNKATISVTESTSNDGLTWKVKSSHTEVASIVWDVLPQVLQKVPKNKLSTIGTLLEDIEITYMKNGTQKERNITLVKTPFLVIHAMRADPELDDDDPNFLIQTKILPTEHITFLDGTRVALSGIVMWRDVHYTAYIRCGSGYYYYDDTRGEVEEPITYQEMLMFDGDRPVVQTNGTLYFYVEAEPISLPTIKNNTQL